MTAERELESSREVQIRRALRDFQEVREAWEEERRDELQRLREESRMLQEAWNRLEKEQRQLMAERELARRTLSSADSQAASADQEGQGQHEPLVRGMDRQSEAASAAEQSSWLQFQRMRREMQAHVRPQT